MNKICSKCKIEKPIDLYGKDKNMKDGFTRLCKSCKNSYKRCKIQSNAYYMANKDKIKDRYQLNIDQNRKVKKAYYLANKEEKKANRKRHYQLNREKIILKRRASNMNPTDRMKHNEKIKLQRKNNPLLMLKTNVNGRIRAGLKNVNCKKNNNTIKYIGCSIDFLKKYLERQFKKGMTWENYGKYGWHIDHIIPLSSAKTEEEMLKLVHYTNLQPLWATENLSKNAKIPQVQIKLTI